jgi:glycine oxidase
VSETFDCIVIGGGAVGLAIAYELSTHGQRVAVVDAARAKHQASWAAAGMIPPADLHQAHDAWQKLVARGHQLHPLWAARLLESTGIDPEYRACGAVHFARTPGESAALAATCRQWHDDGIAAEPVEMAQLMEIEPAFSQLIAAKEGFRAFWIASEACVRPPRYLKALRCGCEQQGVRVVDALVRNWNVVRDRVNSVETPVGILAADSFCLATGAWTGLNLEPFGMRIEMKPWRGQMLMLSPITDESGRPIGPRVVINEGPNYLVPRDDGRIVVGSTVEEVGFETGNTLEAIESLRAFADEILPAWRCEVTDQWSGLRPGTGDGIPYLGFVPSVENLLVAAGHFRSGIAVSPATAELVRQLILGQGPLIDAWPFRLHRE